jgi:hypothetical protein
MSRARLPNRRASATFDFTCTNLCYTCTYSCDASGKITELFLGNHKSNSAADTVARDAAIVCSLAGATFWIRATSPASSCFGIDCR